MSHGNGRWRWLPTLVGAMTVPAWAAEGDPPPPELQLTGHTFTEAFEAIGYTPAASDSEKES